MTYNPGIPNAGDLISVSQGQIKTNFTQLNTQFGIDHVPFNNGGSNGSGFHKKVTLTAPSAPTGSGTIGVLHSVNGTGVSFSGVPLPFFANSVGDFPMIPDVAKGASTDWSFKIGKLIVNFGYRIPTTQPVTITWNTSFTSDATVMTVQGTSLSAGAAALTVIGANHTQAAFNGTGSLLGMYYLAIGT